MERGHGGEVHGEAGVDVLEFCGQEVSGGMQWLTEGHKYGRGRHTKCGGRAQ